MLPSQTHQTVQEEPEGMLDVNCHYGEQKIASKKHPFLKGYK